MAVQRRGPLSVWILIQLVAVNAQGGGGSVVQSLGVHGECTDVLLYCNPTDPEDSTPIVFVPGQRSYSCRVPSTTPTINLAFLKQSAATNVPVTGRFSDNTPLTFDCDPVGTSADMVCDRIALPWIGTYTFDFNGNGADSYTVTIEKRKAGDNKLFGTVSVAVGLPIGVFLLFAFFRKRDKIPIKGRKSGLAMFSSACLITWCLITCLRRIFLDDFPCDVHMWTLYICSVFILNTYLLRVYSVYMEMLHGAVGMERERNKTDVELAVWERKTQAEPEAKEEVVEDVDTSRGFARIVKIFWRLVSKSIANIRMLMVLAFCFVLLAPAFFVTQRYEDIHCLKGEGCTRLWHGAQYALAAYWAVYVGVALVLACRMPKSRDHVSIKLEFAWALIPAILLAVAWAFAIFYPPVSTFSREVFPLEDLFLNLICFWVACTSLGIPLFLNWNAGTEEMARAEINTLRKALYSKHERVFRQQFGKYCKRVDTEVSDIGKAPGEGPVTTTKLQNLLDVVTDLDHVIKEMVRPVEPKLMEQGGIKSNDLDERDAALLKAELRHQAQLTLQMAQVRAKHAKKEAEDAAKRRGGPKPAAVKKTDEEEDPEVVKARKTLAGQGPEPITFELVDVEGILEQFQNSLTRAGAQAAKESEGFRLSELQTFLTKRISSETRPEWRLTLQESKEDLAIYKSKLSAKNVGRAAEHLDWETGEFSQTPRIADQRSVFDAIAKAFQDLNASRASGKLSFILRDSKTMLRYLLCLKQIYWRRLSLLGFDDFVNSRSREYLDMLASIRQSKTGSNSSRGAAWDNSVGVDIDLAFEMEQKRQADETSRLLASANSVGTSSKFKSKLFGSDADRSTPKDRSCEYGCGIKAPLYKCIYCEGDKDDKNRLPYEFWWCGNKQDHAELIRKHNEENHPACPCGEVTVKAITCKTCEKKQLPHTVRFCNQSCVDKYFAEHARKEHKLFCHCGAPAVARCSKCLEENNEYEFFLCSKPYCSSSDCPAWRQHDAEMHKPGAPGSAF